MIFLIGSGRSKWALKAHFFLNRQAVGGWIKALDKNNRGPGCECIWGWMSQQIEWMEKVEHVANEICQREGCFLYDLEFLGSSHGRTLRVYIDKDEGAGIADCSNVSKGLNEFLDAGEVIPGGHYNLEISTPGVDRPLRKKWHFEKVVGKKIWVKSVEAFETLGVQIERLKKSKQMEADLKGVDGEWLVFDVKEGEVRLPISALEKAKLVFEFKKNAKNKRGS